MSQNSPNNMRDEYNFSKGVRGKHHEAYNEGTNVVLLEPDIARAFKDSAAVNRALRLLLEIAHSEVSQSPTNAQPVHPADARTSRR